MVFNHDDLGRSARAMSDVGAFVERAAHITNPSHSKFGRASAAISLATLGARLLPVGWRFMKRNPVASIAVLTGVAVAVFLTRPPRADGSL
jgi:hypothetical protein